MLGEDSNHIQKEKIIAGMLSVLFKDEKFCSVLKINEQTSLELSEDVIRRKIFKKEMISNLIEYGRPVHAEMSAITSAARLGLSVNKAFLYCTTFPCHLCAKHIVASGIKKVIFIEPYPKSLASYLYADSIEVENKFSADKVIFYPFTGVAPRRFIDFFLLRDADKRKQADGKKIEWQKYTATPRLKRFDESYLTIEEHMAAEILDLVSNGDER